MVLAQKLMRERNYFAAMMVNEGDAGLRPLMRCFLGEGWDGTFNVDFELP